MRNKLILFWLFVCSAAPAWAQISVRIGVPGIDIGINLPLYPELIPVPGYPVYYAPQLNSNYFFYDGMYWVFQDDDWYASSWYNGPWSLVDQELVPLFVLRIPVRYYRQTPIYFRDWRRDAPPRWGEHWGNNWQKRHHGWDKWNRSMPAARPPLPVYQRNYTGARYPQWKEQQSLQNKNYRYQPNDPIVRQHVQELRKQATSAPARSASLENQSRSKSSEKNTGTGDAGRDTPHANPRISPPPPAQAPQPPRQHSQQAEQHQQPTKTQHPDNQSPHQAAPQAATRPQKAEHQQDRERANERAKDNDKKRDKDDEPGADRKK
jgi:hypothetical protein